MTRRTYHYDEATKQMVEGPAPSRVVGIPIVNDMHYSANPFVAHDGTVIDSKRKHAEYMKRHSLTTVDDFTSQWRRDAIRRADVYEGRHDKAERARDIARAVEKHRG